MDRPPALHHAEAIAREPGADTAVRVWESDLTDLAALPLTAVDSLTPLDSTARQLAEVLRARGGIRGGEPGGGARAE